MALKVANDYSHISEAWFLGDDGDISDHSQKQFPMTMEFDPQRGRLLLEYMQYGLTMAQACIEVPLHKKMAVTWSRGGRGAPPNYVSAFKKAREQQIHSMADDVVDIADGTGALERFQVEKDTLIDNPIRRPIEHVIQRHLKKLKDDRSERIGSRKWYVSKILPTYYGDKVQLEHSGGDKSVKVDFTKLTTEQLEALAKIDAELSDGSGN